MDGGGIYVIRNKRNGNVYVGKTNNFRKRRNQHFTLLRNKRHFNKHMQRAFHLYGENAFEFDPIEKIEDEEKRIEREEYWIEIMRADYNAYQHESTEMPDNSFHIMYTKELRLGEKYKRPLWHAWVYGGDPNPIHAPKRRTSNVTKSYKRIGITT